VLSLRLYKSEQPSAATATKPTEESKTAEKATEESASTTATAGTSAAVKDDEGGHDPLKGLDDMTKTCFEV